MTTDRLPTENESLEYIRRNFGVENVEQRGLLIAEESGEVCRAVLKRGQGIRGSYEDWTVKLREEVADVYIALLAMAACERFSLHDVVADRWEEVSARDFVADPIGNGLPIDEDA